MKNFSKFSKTKSYHAFTLSEILITLGIISVVAALTIPPLMAKFENQKNIELLKKFYSTFSQALKNAAYKEGYLDDLSCYYEAIGVTNNSNTQDRVEKAIASISKELVNIKSCQNPTGTGFALGQCTDYKMNNNYDGTGIDMDFHYNLVTPDGMYISYTASGSSVNGGWTLVDVNGSKKPNRQGRDIFTFWNFEGNKVLSPVNMGNCTTENKYGQSCAYRIISNGWKMDY